MYMHLMVNWRYGHAKTIRVQPRETDRADEYYGWPQVAKTSARLLSILLGCPETLPSTNLNKVSPNLAQFIASAPCRLPIPLCMHRYALHLIWRVKILNPGFKPKHAARDVLDGAYAGCQKFE
ncbi:unnamed protein product [Rhizoctonia solani]|uniref:Uncharacterized protein n=1 Tax=Rhizoctonia solani TaxID=456999 RepID=A0A8H3BRB6_9AGAM|nr:unnamed protein product [Rhizoctonia solani]